MADKNITTVNEISSVDDSDKVFVNDGNTLKQITVTNLMKKAPASSGGGTTDYNDLTNQPQLNGVTLEGNKTLDQIGALQKNQGSGNSGKYLSVGSNGDVTLVDPPTSGGSIDPEQVNQAVEDYLTENPVSGMTEEQEQQLNQNTTDVADLKSAINSKVNKTGWTPNTFIGIDENGEIVEKDALEITDKSITPQKTSFMTHNWDEQKTLKDVEIKGIEIRSNGTYYKHRYNGHYNISIPVTEGSKLIIKAYSSYINWIQTSEDIEDNGKSVLAHGYTTTNLSMRTLEIEIVSGATFIIFDFGKTQPDYLSAGIENDTYLLDPSIVEVGDSMKQPRDNRGIAQYGSSGQILYSNGSKTPEWGEKYKDQEIKGKKTTFWPTDNLNLSVKAEPLPKISVPFRTAFYQGNANGKAYYYFVGDTSRKTECVLLKADVEYMIFCKNQMLTGTLNLLTNESLRDLTLEEKNNLETINHINTEHIMYITEDRRTFGLYQTYNGKFKVNQDIYLLNASPDAFNVYLWDDVEYLNTKENLFNIYKYMSNIDFFSFYNKPFDFTTKDRHTGLDFSSFFNKYDFDKKIYRMIRRTNYIDGIALSNLNLYFIGDSITYAASNAGLQRAFRKQVPYKLNVHEADGLAVSGTCITNGYGSPFNNEEPDSTGVNGILDNLSILNAPIEDPIKQPHILIIALGTNDFGNNAPLGDVEAEDRETTFAGCYLKLVEKIRETHPDSAIICMCPFNRNNGDTANTAGNILLDYSRVIHEIVSITPHSWILDLSSHPIINYENYPKAYVDGVHIGKYAHAVVTNYLSELILQIVVESGFDLYSMKID